MIDLSLDIKIKNLSSKILILKQKLNYKNLSKKDSKYQNPF